MLRWRAGKVAAPRDLTARGLSGVRLVTSDAHAGLTAAIAATLPAQDDKIDVAMRGRYRRQDPRRGIDRGVHLGNAKDHGCLGAGSNGYLVADELGVELTKIDALRRGLGNRLGTCVFGYGEHCVAQQLFSEHRGIERSQLIKRVG